MDIYIKIFEVIFPVFFVIGVGYYLGKKNPKFDTNFITNFAGNIGTPAMIFYTVTTTGITLSVFIHYFIYALIMISGFAVIGLIALFFLKKGTFLAGTATAEPFLGFLAMRASLSFTSKIPNPLNSTRSFFDIALLIVSKKTLTILTESFWYILECKPAILDIRSDLFNTSPH